MSLFDASVRVDVIRRAKDQVRGVSRVSPDRTAVAIIEQAPGAAAIRRAIKSAASGSEDQVRRGWVHMDGMNIRVDERWRRTFKAGIPIAAISQTPALPVVIRP